MVHLMLFVLTIALALAGCCSGTPVSVPSHKRDEARLRISGGDYIDISSAPYAAQLLVSSYDSLAFHCGAVIIADRMVLTSADCVPDGVSALKVRVGTADSNTGGVIYDVVSVLTNPDYNASTKSHNLALVTIKGKFRRSPYVQVASLVTPDQEPQGGDKLTVVGWGLVESSSHFYSTHLKALTVMLIPNLICSKAYDSTSNNRVVDDTTLCAAGEKWKGICRGDEGGPLVNDLGELVGLVSWGTDCGYPGHGGIYSNLANPVLSSWIATNTD